ncbi:hypothetical protein J7T55_014159 [Diaporthe amygdali]|uniref:uncharacterized protein n=1 Tax=Phomopsis amygdali TaxID=1214568 RepID=UPI0022FEC2C5|nr:uncharacterized protein J7T55_014159 [Diaporthe amygdali]KAJ0109597.1 hypothetical protein J7T55_014159 [Diaporthe amygdali]
MAHTATTGSSYNNNSYYYCYDCGYYIPSGYYCTHSYYGNNYANTVSNVNNSSHGVVLVNRRHRSSRSPRHTTRYTVTTRYYV